MDNYYYELKYVNDDMTVVHKFPAGIDISKLADYLKNFLKGCSWTESQVEELINRGE